MLKTFLNQLSSYFPTKLPLGMTEFDAWSASILALLGPIADQDSLKFATATEVVRLGPEVRRISKQYFVRRIKAGAAKQIAGAVMYDMKEKQKAQQEVLLAKQLEKTTEVTVAPKAADGQPQ